MEEVQIKGERREKIKKKRHDEVRRLGKREKGRR